MSADGGAPRARAAAVRHRARPTARPGSAARATFLRDALAELERRARRAACTRASSTSSSCTLDAPPRAAVLAGGAAARGAVRRRAVMGALVEAGAASPSASSPSIAPHQFEIPVRPAAGMAAADRAVVLARSCARSRAAAACARRSCRCSTPPRPATACTSTSRCSTATGRAALYDPERARLPERARRAVRRRASCARPRAERADRARARSRRRAWRRTAGAPAPSAWRSATARRCCGSRRSWRSAAASPAAQMRLEYRGADAAANPYLALGAILRAGLDGRARRAGRAADPRPRPRAARCRRGGALRRRRAAGHARGVAARRSSGRRRPRLAAAAAATTRTVASSASRSTARASARSRRDVQALCRDLLTELLAHGCCAAIERELPARGRAAPPPARRTPSSRTPRSETAAAVAAELPVACETAAGTGRIARIGAGDGAGAWRCAPSSTGCRSRSAPARRSARRGEAMHACGHDVHMAALVALARAAHALGDELPAPLLAVFQPSEEAYPSGAEQLARGELAAAPRRRRSWRRTCTRSCRGARSRSTRARSTPRATPSRSPSRASPSHGAYPHRGRDPVLALAQIVVALHAAARPADRPARPGVADGRRARGGQRGERDPRAARARAGRCARTGARTASRCASMVEEVAAGVAAAHGCRGARRARRGRAGARERRRRSSRARARCWRRRRSRPAPEWRSCGSDDFAFFGALVAAGDGVRRPRRRRRLRPRPLHHPELLVPTRRSAPSRAPRPCSISQARDTIEACPTASTSPTPTRPTR